MIKRNWVEGPKLEFLGQCKFANCHSNIVDLQYLSNKYGINLDSDDDGCITIFYDEKIYNTPVLIGDVIRSADGKIVRDEEPYLVRFQVKGSTDQLFIYKTNFSESIRVDKNKDMVVILPICDLDKLKLIIKMD